MHLFLLVNLLTRLALSRESLLLFGPHLAAGSNERCVRALVCSSYFPKLAFDFFLTFCMELGDPKHLKK